jgi:hypothetical protein
VKRKVLAAVTLLATSLSAIVAGCSVGETATDVAYEPIKVENGVFFTGSIPSSDDAGASVVGVNSAANFAFAGQAGKVLSGDATGTASAILLRFADLGTGYWSVPVVTMDPQMVGDLTWTATIDFGWNIPSGTHQMNIAAIDMNGVVGPISQNPYLIQSATPKGALVISLVWDSNADLDLHVKTPEGEDLSPENPTTNPDAGTMQPSGGGYVDRDSNTNCVQDGFRQEDAVFATTPPPGTYLISVDMFSACGAPSADFLVVVRTNGKVEQTIPGRLLGTDADSGGPGLFVGQLKL